MSWDKIKEIIGTAAPLVGSSLGGKAGEAVGGLVAKALGVEAKPEAVLEALQKDKEWAYKLTELERTHERQILELRLKASTDELVSNNKADTDTLTQVNETMRAESSSEDLWQRRWRPFIGFSLGASFAYVCVFVSYLMYLGVVNKDIEAMRNIPTLVDTYTMLFAVPGAILGVSAWGRNKLKLQRASQ